MTFDTYNPTKEDLIANAPEGATHYSLGEKDRYFAWYKESSEGGWYFMLEIDRGTSIEGWSKSSGVGDMLEIPFQTSCLSLGVTEDNPTTIRERILEIRKEREAGIEEEQELIDKLASMGFKLLEDINKKLEEVKEKHDLQDWRNWKAGDLLERIDNQHPHVYVPGKLYKVKSTEPEIAVYDEFGDDSYCELKYWEYEYFKFHSRPAK